MPVASTMPTGWVKVSTPRNAMLVNNYEKALGSSSQPLGNVEGSALTYSYHDNGNYLVIKTKNNTGFGETIFETISSELWQYDPNNRYSNTKTLD